MKKTEINYITVLDTIKPVVTAVPVGGNYDTTKTVTLTTTDEQVQQQHTTLLTSSF